MVCAPSVAVFQKEGLSGNNHTMKTPKKFPYLSVDRLTRVITYRWEEPRPNGPKQRSAKRLTAVPEPSQSALKAKLRARGITLGTLQGHDCALFKGQEAIQQAVDNHATELSLEKVWDRRPRVEPKPQKFTSEQWEQIVEHSKAILEDVEHSKGEEE